MSTAIERHALTDSGLRFFEMGMEYYLAGRFLSMAHMTLTPGILYHHAVERFLKAQLCKRFTSQQLLKDFGHRLRPAWAEFKADFPTEDLGEFDTLIGELDQWEKIRYPDDLLKRGGRIGIGWESSGVTGEKYSKEIKQVPKYNLAVRSVDRFLARIAPLISVNPAALTACVMITDYGLTIALHENPEVEPWFSGRTARGQGGRKEAAS